MPVNAAVIINTSNLSLFLIHDLKSEIEAKKILSLPIKDEQTS